HGEVTDQDSQALTGVVDREGLGGAGGGHAVSVMDPAGPARAGPRRPYAPPSRCQGAWRFRREARRWERCTDRACRRRYQSGEVSARTSGRGAMRETSPAVRYFTEGMDRTLPLAVSLSACSTT